MSTKTFDGQTARFLAAAVTCMPSLPSDVMQGWIDNPKALKKALRVLLPIAESSSYPMLAETRLLKPVSKSTVPARTKPFNAATFYQTSTGLYVHDTFADRLDLSARQTVDSVPERPYVASLLKANAYDTDIRKELPDIHLSTFEDIAGLIEAQPNGKSGFLLNNGYANIFYVEGKNGGVFAVLVRWYSDYREWDVNDWKLDELGHWNADYQVLCPGNAAL